MGPQRSSPRNSHQGNNFNLGRHNFTEQIDVWYWADKMK